eukprot:TRINITY_DN608_c3_g1_i3.p1 TRINITY_DN608_c3_g1~~TRINITY_DN608_c3_g1_i3.p1  ORF type:complete len:406 (+),score=122.99 TRINITY_DN608_c3_g1_i3:107-1324(+)
MIGMEQSGAPQHRGGQRRREVLENAGEPPRVKNQGSSDSGNKKAPKHQEPITPESDQRGVEVVNEVASDDRGMPDGWIKRNPKLIRLTGRFPLNAEPPTDELMKNLVTPSSLHYVRNHGQVPRLTWQYHMVEVGGLVERPRAYSMDELAAMAKLRLQVFMVCDGNRRKEINMIKPTRGFGWGPGGCGNSLWTGVPLARLLREVGVQEFESGTRYVWFEGSETLGKGVYGTSIPLQYALDEHNDILLAYEMNNERLPPDHGYPLRLVIPGFVGGRNVKWLKKIVVADKESDSWYHWHDNKVLPANVTDGAMADAGKWWNRPEFALYELSINSVITHPADASSCTLDDVSSSCVMKGFAYTGGGRRIIRVELSFDGGLEWEAAEIQVPRTRIRVPPQICSVVVDARW